MRLVIYIARGLVVLSSVMFNRQGKPDEEMFLRKPAGEPDTPTVGPLRISKRDSVSSQSTTGTGSASGQQNGSASGGGGRSQVIPGQYQILETSTPLVVIGGDGRGGKEPLKRLEAGELTRWVPCRCRWS